MKKWPWFALSFLVIVADQLTKYLALTKLTAYQARPIFPMLNFTLAFNTGAAFNFLSNSGNWHRWFFVLFSLSVSTFLVIWLARLPRKATLHSLALSLILGGALGNFYDRLTRGNVIDFIDFYYENHHWPVFNLADSAICVGAVLLLFCLNKKS